MSAYESYLQYPLHYNAAHTATAGCERERTVAGIKEEGGAVATALATAAASASVGVSSASAQRERFLLRIRREMQLLASEHHNAICAAQHYFPHLFEDTPTAAAPTAATTTAAAEDTGDGPEEGFPVGGGGGNDVRSISPVQQPSAALQSSSESPPVTAAAAAPVASSLSAASATALAPAHPPSAAGFVFPPLPQLSPSHWRDRCINYDLLRTQMKKVVYIQSQIAAFIADQHARLRINDAASEQGAPTITHEAETRKESLLAQQAAADAADAARRVRRDRTPRPPDSLADRERAPMHLGGEDAEPPKDSSALQSSGGAEDPALPAGLSPSILAALRAHPSFQMLRQAHQTFWALLKTELGKAQAFVKDSAHAARTEQLWAQMNLQTTAAAPDAAPAVKQEKSAEDMSNSPNAGAAADPAVDAAAASTYLTTCPCGCSASLADAFAAVVHEIASTGVSTRAAAAPSSSSSSAPSVCPSSKQCAQQYLCSLLHVDQLRKFLLVNGVIYCRLLDQFAHYTAPPTPLLEAYQNAITNLEKREHQAAQTSASSSAASSSANSKQTSPQLKALATAAVVKHEPEAETDTRMGSTSPNVGAADHDSKLTLNEGAVKAEVPPPPPLPATSMQAAHLAAFLGSDPQWPFAPVDSFARLLQRAESLGTHCFGLCPRTYPNVSAGMEGLLPAVPPPCGVCHAPEMTAPTLLPCAHQFCLGCLARQPGFGVCCPLPACGKEVASSCELLARISGEELIRAEEGRIRRGGGSSASAPASASKRGSMRVDVPVDLAPVVVAPPNAALQAQTELTHDQMQLQRKLLQLHFQQLQAAQQAQQAQQASVAAASSSSPTISSFSAVDVDDDAFLGALPTVLPADQQTQAQIQQLYQTAAASQAKRQAVLIAQQQHNRRQLAALQQRHKQQQQQGNHHMSHSATHSPVRGNMHAPAAAGTEGASASGSRSAMHSRSGSVTSSMDGGEDYQHAAFANAHGSAAMHDLSASAAPQLHKQRSDEANAALLSSHQPREGDERPLTDEDLSSGNYVSGCGGTVAAPLQYEEVSVVGANGAVSTLLKPKRGQGYSCHHCKTTREPAVLFFCSTLLQKGANVKKCRKKVCESCLRRLYAPEFAEGGRYWSCPSCKGSCVCASCERKITGRAAPKKKKAGQIDDGGATLALAGPSAAAIADPSAPERPQSAASTPSHSRTLSGSKRPAAGGEGTRGKGRARSNSHSAIQLAAVAAAAAAAASSNLDPSELSIHQQLALDRMGGGAAAIGQPHPRNAAAIIAARHIAQSAHEFSPLSPLTGHRGGGSERNSPVPGASPLKSLSLARGGSHGDLLSSAGGRGSSRSRKGSTALSRNATPTQQMLGLGLAGSSTDQWAAVHNPPPHHRAQTMDVDAARLRTQHQPQQHYPPMHGGPHAPLSPSMGGMMQGLNSARRASGATTSAPTSHSTSPFHASQQLGLSLNSSTVVSDSSDADVTSPSAGGGAPHTRSVSPPALGTNSRQMHEYMHVKNMGLARHTQHQSQLQLHLQQQAQQQQQQQHHAHNLLMSPPGPAHSNGAHHNPLLSPIYPASHYSQPPPTDSASSSSGGLFSPPSSATTTAGVLSSPLSSTVTVGGMNARDLSRLSLGELQAMNDQIEMQLAQLSAQTGVEGDGPGADDGNMQDDLAGQQQSQQPHSSSQTPHAFSLLSPPAILHSSSSLFQSSPPLCIGGSSGGGDDNVGDMGLNDLHKMERMLKAQQEQLNREQAQVLAQAEEISMARRSQQQQVQVQRPSSPSSESNSGRLLPDHISISGPTSGRGNGGGGSTGMLETPLALHPPSSLLSLPRTGTTKGGGSTGSGGGALSPLDVPLMSPGVLDGMMMMSPPSHSGSGLGPMIGVSPFLASSSTSVPMAASTPATGAAGGVVPAASDTPSLPTAANGGAASGSSAPLNIQLVTPLGVTMHVPDSLIWPNAQASQGSGSSMLSTPAPSGGLRSSSGAHGGAGLGGGLGSSSSMLTPGFRAGPHGSPLPLLGGLGLQWDASGLAHTPGPPLLNPSVSPGVPMSPAQ